MHSSSFRVIHHTSNRRAVQLEFLSISKCRSCGSPRRSPVGKDCPKPMPETEMTCSSTESCSWALASVHWRASGWQSDDGDLQGFTWMLFREGDESWAYFLPLFQYDPVSTWNVLQNPAAVWSLRCKGAFDIEWMHSDVGVSIEGCGRAKSNMAGMKKWSTLSSFWVTWQVRCWNPNSILELPKWQCRMPKTHINKSRPGKVNDKLITRYHPRFS